MENIPLAERIRPTNFTDFVGQDEIAGKNGIIKKLLKSSKETGFFPSIIFWGPPGSGKTTLARIIAKKLKREFFEFSAVNTTVGDIQAVIRESNTSTSKQLRLKANKNHLSSSPLIFLDEIHRFNKAQQDKLLPHVEKGETVLIGATTENPSFEVISPLLSRSRVIVLAKLGEKDLGKILARASKLLKIKLDPKAKTYLKESSNGDARVLLTVLEIASHIDKGKVITLVSIEEALQKKQLSFDKKGDEYFNVISAFIKSMRASDSNAALYYLARMIEAGQDPLYIARRMVVFASEDVGMAVPTALVVANEVFRACETIGYPECAINLAHGTVYLAKAQKDRRAYDGLQNALRDVRNFGNLPIPKNILNAPTKLMKDLDYGKDYEMYPEKTKNLLPDKLRKKKYYIKKDD
ncbi:replication-associated recombination protein A [Patescibacteria group bacterium]